MKTLFAIFAISIVSAPAFAAGSKCESKAMAEYKKSAVEAEMQSISGKTSQLEASSERTRLQETLSSKRQRCMQLARNTSKRMKM